MLLENDQDLSRDPWVEVWVDAPQGGGCYTYQRDPQLSVPVGSVVTVPFGSRQVGGLVLRGLAELPAGLDPSRVRPIEAVVGDGLLPPTFWPLLQRVAEHYITPLGEVLRTALPAGILARSQRRVKLVMTAAELMPTLTGTAEKVVGLLGSRSGDLSWRFIQQQVPQAAGALGYLQKQGVVATYWQAQGSMQPKYQQAITLCDDSEEELTEGQRELLRQLKKMGGDLWLTDLLKETGSSRQQAQALERKGRVRITKRQVWRSMAEPEVSRDQPKDLTTAQAQALQSIVASLGSPHPFLLHGVTGSGKTEVYLQAIAPVLAQGSSALVLVPEIGLTPQLTDRFRARFGSRVLVYHSALGAGERFDAWRQMLMPVPQVVIGTRSAVFAPLDRLGLIVLDEEHDDSFKQDQPQPCYHARQVAQWRSQLQSCPLVLGSATPAVETYLAAQKGEVTRLGMPERIRGVEHSALRDPIPQQPDLPQITLVDMREELHKRNFSVFSGYLQQALRETIDQGQQAILFVPRRGYSTFVSCRSCGDPLTCPHCSVSLTFHQLGERLRCHYCGHQEIHPQECPSCGSGLLKHFGSGTQKVVEALQSLDPQWRILRYDSDATQRKGSHRALLEQFRAGEADILVGTQMLTKGIDIPQVTLVGVMAADGILNQADFRASERAFQLLTQVAGRAGRGSLPGRAIIQTYLPDHPTLEAVQAYDYESFMAQELQQRQEALYPPMCGLILLRLSSTDLPALQTFAQDLRHHLEVLGIPPHTLLGPCPADVERVNNIYRWQLLLKITDEMDLAQLRGDLGSLKSPAGIRLTVDVDPLRIL